MFRFCYKKNTDKKSQIYHLAGGEVILSKLVYPKSKKETTEDDGEPLKIMDINEKNINTLVNMLKQYEKELPCKLKIFSDSDIEVQYNKLFGLVTFKGINEKDNSTVIVEVV